MEKNLELQQTLDIVHNAYLVPNAITRTAQKYNVGPNQMCRWKNVLTGLDEEDGQHQLTLLTLFKGHAKKTLHSGKVCIDIAHYGAIRHMLDTLCSAG